MEARSEFEGTQVEDVQRYLGTVSPGLEPVAKAELEAKVPGVQVEEILRGRIIFSCNDPVRSGASPLWHLRSFDNLYSFIARFPVGKYRTELSRITEAIKACDLNVALSVAREWGAVSPADRNRPPKVSVSASRQGRHTYSRFEAADAALQALTEGRRFRAGTPQDHDYHFRLDVFDKQALFSLKLSPPTFRFRGARDFSRAALRPTVAHGLIWLSKPRPDDVFLDPFCGSGTIVTERAAYDAAALVASDVSPAVIAVARRNVPEYVSLQCWDARQIGMASGSVTAIVTNLPWGNQISIAGGQLDSLYVEALIEMKRVPAPGGRAILLTSEGEAIQRAANDPRQPRPKLRGGQSALFM